jgi:hypothetical protein
MVIAKWPQVVRARRVLALTQCTVKPTPVTDSHTARSQKVLVAVVLAGAVGRAWAGSAATVASVASATHRHNERMLSSLPWPPGVLEVRRVD